MFGGGTESGRRGSINYKADTAPRSPKRRGFLFGGGDRVGDDSDSDTNKPERSGRSRGGSRRWSIVFPLFDPSEKEKRPDTRRCKSEATPTMKTGRRRHSLFGAVQAGAAPFERRGSLFGSAGRRGSLAGAVSQSALNPYRGKRQLQFGSAGTARRHSMIGSAGAGQPYTPGRRGSLIGACGEHRFGVSPQRRGSMLGADHQNDNEYGYEEGEKTGYMINENEEVNGDEYGYEQCTNGRAEREGGTERSSEGSSHYEECSNEREYSRNGTRRGSMIGTGQSANTYSHSGPRRGSMLGNSYHPSSDEYGYEQCTNGKVEKEGWTERSLEGSIRHEECTNEYEYSRKGGSRGFMIGTSQSAKTYRHSGPRRGSMLGNASQPRASPHLGRRQSAVGMAGRLKGSSRGRRLSVFGKKGAGGELSGGGRRHSIFGSGWHHDSSRRCVSIAFPMYPSPDVSVKSERRRWSILFPLRRQ